MPYVTTPMAPTYRQITLDQILDGMELGPLKITENRANTRTVFTKNPPKEITTQFDLGVLYNALCLFAEQTQELRRAPRESLYHTFYIPKHSGGLRQIDEPCPELMNALRRLKGILETSGHALYHTSAFAYVKQRCNVNAVERHQKHDSRWFLKLDFHNFFGSTTKDFVMRQLSMIYPFSELMKAAEGREVLDQSISLCFLRGGLPQGTPISPMLTNLIMIPIDHRLYNTFRNHKKRILYTRYADDMCISSKYDFNQDEVIRYVKQVLQEFRAPYTLNEDKTRYGSRNGNNWNLGVMLNKDNQITIGHKKKKQFRAMVHNYVMDRKNGHFWPLHDVQVLNGLLSYYKMVEKETMERIIQFFNQKYQVDFEKLMKEDMS